MKYETYMKDKKEMLFPGKCPLNRETCENCEQYEVCIEFYKIGYEPRLFQNNIGEGSESMNWQEYAEKNLLAKLK